MQGRVGAVRGEARAPREAVAVMSLLYLVGALSLVGGVVGALVGANGMPPGVASVNRIGAAAIPVCLTVAAVTWRRRGSLPPLVLHGMYVVAAVLPAAVIVTARSGAGAVTMTFVHVALAVYAGYYFPRRVTRAYVAGMAVLIGAALAASQVGPLAVSWAVVVVEMVGLSEVFGRLVDRLRSAATIDPLTRALNRAGLMAALDREVGRARRSGEPLTVVVVDLDGFKAVNDRHGHAAGDELLRGLARAWRGCLRAQDELGRLGGDEFVLVLPATSEHQAGVVVRRLHEAHPATWSAGVATWAVGEAVDALLRRADHDLYAAKAGRGADTAR